MFSFRASFLPATLAQASDSEANNMETASCALCRRSPPLYAQSVAYGSFDRTLRAAVHLLKYDRVLPAADFLGQRLATVFSKLPVVEARAPGAAVWLVIPVPLHSSKLRQRGFNQAELIARAAIRQPEWRHLRLETRALVRYRETVSQAGLTRHQRRENIRGAFRVQSPGAVVDQEILLVDDVFTTGATVSECARVLLRAGARRIWVATVARALKADRVLHPIVTEQEVDLAGNAA